MFLTSHPQYCDGPGNPNFGNISWFEKRCFRMRSRKIWQISKTWAHLYWMKTKTHMNDNLHPSRENKDKLTFQRRQSRSGVHQNSGVQWLMVVYWRRPTWRKCNSVWLYNRTLHHALLGTWTKRQTDRHTDRQKDGQINRDIQTDQKEYEGKSWNKLTRKHSDFF